MSKYPLRDQAWQNVKPPRRMRRNHALIKAGLKKMRTVYKAHFFLILICSFLSLCLLPIITYAATSISPDSSSGNSGNTFYDIPVGGGTDPNEITQEIPVVGLSWEFSSTTPFTILSFTFAAGGGVDFSITCDGKEIPPSHMALDLAIFDVFGAPNFVYHSVQSEHCSDFSIYPNTDGYAVIQYVPYDTRLATSTTANQQTNGDIVLGLGFIIVLLALGMMTFIFNSMFTKKPWKRY